LDRGSQTFKFVKHPLVSAAMVLETFMEAARILYPHLQVRGVRQVRLMDMIQCPPGSAASRISCSRAGTGLREVLCEVSLATQEISPAGRLTDRFTPHCKGSDLDGGGGYLGEELRIFLSGWTNCGRGPWIIKRCLNGTKIAAASKAGIV